MMCISTDSCACFRFTDLYLGSGETGFKNPHIMKLTVLGCGDAFASSGRFNTSFLLEQGDKKILVDCGASTLIRLKQLGISVLEINTIIISHFHGDHFGGLPFFVLSSQIEHQRKGGFTIIGPQGIKEKVYQLQEGLYPGTTGILDGLGVQFVEFHDSEWINHEDLSIYARKVTHAPPSNPHGVKIKWADKTFSFSGDTEWNDSLIDLAKDSDAFVIECNNYQLDSPGHLSYRNILERCKDFTARKLLLSHMGTEVIDAKDIVFTRLEDGMVLDL